MIAFHICYSILLHYPAMLHGSSISDVWLGWELLLVIEYHIDSVFVPLYSTSHLRNQHFILKRDR